MFQSHIAHNSPIGAQGYVKKKTMEERHFSNELKY